MENLAKQIEVNDIEMNYYEKGVGKTLLILHGNGMDGWKHKKMIQYFSGEFNVIAIDTRAHGKSTVGSKKFTVELFADDVIEFCRLKNIKKANIIGYSDGANIALWLAKKDSKLVEKLVLISGNYKGSGVCLWFRILLFIYKIILLPMTLFIKKIKIRYNLIDVMLHNIGVKEEELRNIQNKTLVLYAGIDFITKKHTENIAKNIKGATLKRIVASHHLDIFKKEETIEVIDKFLKTP